MKKNKPQKILVTGGAGYIGSHVVKTLGEQGYSITVIDNLSTGNRDAVLYGEFIQGDLQDQSLLESVFSSHQFDGVMHFAGSIKVPESVKDPLKYYQNNTINSYNIIACCEKFGVDHFVFSSTAAIYGEPEIDLICETAAKKPINPYGRSKLNTEWVLEDLNNAKSSFNYVAIRYFNVCGADPAGEIGQAFPEPFHLINIACEVAAGKREKMAIYGQDYPTSDGTCIRDYIHVSDLATAHVLALEYLFENKTSTTVNCGYGNGYSVKEIISNVKEVTGVDFVVDQANRRPGDPPVLVANSDKIKKIFKWQPKHNDLKFIIQSVYDWEQSDTYQQWTRKRS
ncbi:MAG: UDP-glucose 4-epimerase GalE [Halobacteriovoraceae bacterium]|jgi:UDP-glucose 4-epimerase|nr:UDP-glucose 4-epimerase GalE [Halobacteriovoraceae bacterium]